MKNNLCRVMIYIMLLGQVPAHVFAHPSVNAKQMSDTNYGRVTVGKPKIWSFDRVYSTLDGWRAEQTR